MYLAEQIAEKYGVPLGKITFSKYSDGEFQPSFEESIRGLRVFLVCSTFPSSDNLMELLYLYKKSDDEVFPTLDNEIKYSVINHTICS